MPRQPPAGAGAAARAPSGAAARAPASPPASPLSPQRYRALRARYNALLVALYERSTVTLREIAAAAGCTDRAVQMLVRRLLCRPRNAKHCRPGTTIGLRREGPRPPPLNAPATRRVLAAFAAVARELAGSAQARAASELNRATARAARRTARTQSRVMASAARELRHLAAAMDHATAAKDALARGPRRAEARPRARKREPVPTPGGNRIAEQRVLRERQARLREAHDAAGRPEAARPEAPPPLDAEADADRRIDAAVERVLAERRRGPRIRGL